MVVREYSLSKSYKGATCRLLNITYVHDVQCVYCAAGSKAKSKEKGGCTTTRFPCVTITVKYTHKSREAHALLHPDSLQATGAYKQCSYNVCRKLLIENREAVAEYANQWRAKGDSEFDCFYDTNNLASVIILKKHSKFDVINCMVWPSALILVCGVIFFHLETKRRGVPFCGEAMKDDNKEGNATKEKRDSGKHETHLMLLHPYPVNDDYSRVKCKILDEPFRKEMSNSVPSLVKIKVPLEGPKIVIEDENSYITHSVSAEDGLNSYNPPMNDCFTWDRRKEQFADARSKSAESAGSQGSRVTGRETPV